VLLHFYQLDYSPITLAMLFLLYEVAGIVANLGGGWLSARFGITRMLAIGMAAQIIGLLMLSALSPGWSEPMSVAWVVAAQGISGVAKDLTKTASKSAIKATAAAGSGSLFHWVAWFTGSKNAMKGIGFFLGGALLELAGFRPALWLMAGGLALVLTSVLLALPRITLFGARDIWFVVGLPVFLYVNGWTFAEVGGFLALWTIGYGLVQAVAPTVVRRSADGLSQEVPAARAWALVLAAVPALLGLVLAFAHPSRPDLVVAVGLALFGLVFAVNSSLHSYLILAYAGSERTAEDVGFYYAANATGRLLGILLSGLLFQAGGLTACLFGAAALLAVCWATSLALPAAHSGPVAA